MRTLLDSLKLIRLPNLMLISGCQLLVHYLILVPSFSGPIWPDPLSQGLWLLVISTLFLTCGGYLINDYYDVEIDRINHPATTLVGTFVTAKAVLRLYVIITFVGLLAGLLAAKQAGAIWLTGFPFGIAVALWWYSAKLKKVPFWGNLVVALLTGLSVMLVWIFDRCAALHTGATPVSFASHLVWAYAGFAFLMNLIRELVKDIQDVEGDKACGCRTLPVLWSVRSLKVFIFLLAGITLLGIGGAIAYLAVEQQYIACGYAILVMTPAWSVFFIRLSKAKQKRHYRDLSNILKLMILAGILSIPLLFIY